MEYLYGGTGDDTYVVLDAQDTPVEYAGEGHDVVQSSVRWALGDNFEDLVLTGGANINGFGNGLANQLTGDSGNNDLQGYGDFDVLNGGAGNDFYELGDRVYQGFFGYTFNSVTEGFNAGNDTVRVTATAIPATRSRPIVIRSAPTSRSASSPAPSPSISTATSLPTRSPATEPPMSWKGLAATTGSMAVTAPTR